MNFSWNSPFNNSEIQLPYLCPMCVKSAVGGVILSTAPQKVHEPVMVCAPRKWREDVSLPDGTVRRIQKGAVLGTLKEYKTGQLAERALEQRLTAKFEEGRIPSR